MTLVDRLDVAGIAMTCFGSTIAMIGVYLQMNGYFAIKTSDIFRQILGIVWNFLRHGAAAARDLLHVSAGLGEEDRVKTLLGFYCVLFGFFFQMLGSGLLIAAVFAGHGGTATHAAG